jgi:hypothetical protein
MAEHGGYRKPAHPAPVSGPGKYSKRTDGGPAQVLSAVPDQGYGEQKAQMDAQRLAPMGGTAPLPPAPTVSAPSAGGGSAPPSLPLHAPTQRPGEPVTHGVDIGPGGSASALSLPAGGGEMPSGYLTNMLASMSATDMTGTMAKLYEIARQRGV